MSLKSLKLIILTLVRCVGVKAVWCTEWILGVSIRLLALKRATTRAWVTKSICLVAHILIRVKLHLI